MKRNQGTLLPFLKKRIDSGAMVRSDGYRPSRGISHFSLLLCLNGTEQAICGSLGQGSHSENEALWSVCPIRNDVRPFRR
jgi:hypothetical protein